MSLSHSVYRIKCLTGAQATGPGAMPQELLRGVNSLVAALSWRRRCCTLGNVCYWIMVPPDAITFLISNSRVSMMSPRV
jgi:hypothetical protein